MQINEPEIVAEVTQQVMRYEQALVNNEIAVLNELFWHSAHTVRLGASENLFGYDAIAQFRSHRPTKGLQRTVEKVTVSTFSEQLACAHVIFSRPGQPLGRQSQTWVKIDQQWRIVSAHVSTLKS
ncbi:oxalurate catabolism protein HpxZ [Celerinatantimonas diazotrophica]|uniref:Uncharacterized protein DUF3225 n=1 Tax=Celerinatantimonas diazotrophica TaxID=412034 RepID=A0A4V2PNE3_9GAMM|nr:oxalurate catabolism protein HpxZ [Celerinatantimonas diazotrophica]TCK46761.1 uncharacterized protein DUF3225 [Celerinatantimonas diazotrophica]CAG9295464.1 hypothetical protein CEDIAZO_00580 [Celerinatantimonas diazotrophica]